MIIDGKAIAGIEEENIKNEIEQNGYNVTLAVVLVGNNPASEVYVKNKEKACERVGINNITIKMDENSSQEEVESKLKELALDKKVNGILLQLPLPKHLDERKALELIPYFKDVDGLTEQNLGKLFVGNPQIVPCTPLGVIKLLETQIENFSGLDAVVIGRSNLVGKPVAQLLLQKNCSVTHLHSKSIDLQKYVKTADIVVCAVGVRALLKLADFKSGAVVIDVGMNRDDEGKLCGDIEKGEREDIKITPVPKGVGPMTIAMLLKNTLECFKKQ